jgi:hypothetical protein
MLKSTVLHAKCTVFVLCTAMLNHIWGIVEASIVDRVGRLSTHKYPKQKNQEQNTYLCSYLSSTVLAMVNIFLATNKYAIACY